MTLRKKITKKPKTSKVKSVGEETLAFQLRAYNITTFREYHFDPVRKWRFDFAFPNHKIGVEIEGGIYTGGRHTRPKGYIEDMSKYNAASKQGWMVLRYTPKQVKTGVAINEIKKLLGIDV